MKWVLKSSFDLKKKLYFHKKFPEEIFLKRLTQSINQINYLSINKL